MLPFFFSPRAQTQHVRISCVSVAGSLFLHSVWEREKGVFEDEISGRTTLFRMNGEMDGEEREAALDVCRRRRRRVIIACLT